MMWRIALYLHLALMVNLGTADDQCTVRIAPFGTALKGLFFKKINVMGPYMCDVECEQELICQSYNYNIEEKICELNNRTKEARPENFQADPARFYAKRLNGRVPLGSIQELPAESCIEILRSEDANSRDGKYWLDLSGNGKAQKRYCDINSIDKDVADSCGKVAQIMNRKQLLDGVYLLKIENVELQVYCHMADNNQGWTLIARFSNSDGKNWMRDDGRWWYDQPTATGTTNNPSMNDDMISPAFWLVSGREIKITRSDDPSHTPLLQTTGNCLGGQTFRSKITSYGDFRNGKVWASDQCLGNCMIQYGGQYKSTDGFQQAECSGNIQSANRIGFWCAWGTGDGSVIMIGGGGISCGRADHGIGITEKDAASFVLHGSGKYESEYDFGYKANTGNAPSQSYSLNLWIR